MAKTTVVEPILLAYMFCFYISQPLRTQLYYAKSCIRHFNESYCTILIKAKQKTYKHDLDYLQKETSQWAIYDSLVKITPSLIAMLLFTAYFDKVGRKTVMILPIIGGTLSSISLLINSYFMHWPTESVLIGSFLEGIFGQYVAIFASIIAYAADITSVEMRTKRTVIVESMTSLGAVVAYPVGGLMLQQYGFLPTFLLQFSLCIFQLVYWVFLKESYPPQKVDEQSATNSATESPSSGSYRDLLVEVFRVPFKKRDENKRKTLFQLFACLTCFILSKFFISSLLNSCCR